MISTAGVAAAARAGFHASGFAHYAAARPSYSAPVRYSAYPHFNSGFPRADARPASYGQSDYRAGSGQWRDTAGRGLRDEAPARAPRDAGWRDARREDPRWRESREHAGPDAVRWHAAQQPAPIVSSGAVMLAPNTPLAASGAGLAFGLLEDLVSAFFSAGYSEQMSAQDPMDSYAGDDDYNYNYDDHADTARPIIGNDYR